MAFKMSKLVRFGRIGNNVSDFNDSNPVIIERLLRQGYRFQKSLKSFTTKPAINLVYLYNYTCIDRIPSTFLW